MPSVGRSALATASGCCTTSPSQPVGAPNRPRRAASGAAGRGVITRAGIRLDRLGGVSCGLVLALIYSIAYFDPSVDHRLVKHGYAVGTAQRILSERDKAKHPDRMRHYMETYRANALESNSARPDA